MEPSLPREWELNNLLFDLSQELTENEVKDMKYLFRGEGGIGKAVLEKITTASEFFDRLRSENYFHRNDVSLLEQILNRIGRMDLVRMIKDYSTNLSTLPYADISDTPLHKIVLCKATQVLLSDMDPVLLLDALLEEQVLDYQVVRDIQEQQTTTEKNRKIIEQFLKRDIDAYNSLKKCLLKSHQKHLAEQLTSLEVQKQQKLSLQSVQPIVQQENWNKSQIRNLDPVGQHPIRYRDEQPDKRNVSTITDLSKTVAEMNLRSSNDDGNAEDGRTRSVGLDFIDATGELNSTANDAQLPAVQWIKTEVISPMSRTFTSVKAVGSEEENQARPIRQPLPSGDTRNGAPVMESMSPMIHSTNNLTLDRSFDDGRLEQMNRQHNNNVKKHLEKNLIGQGGYRKVFKVTSVTSVEAVGSEQENQARPIRQPLPSGDTRNGAPVMESTSPIFPSTNNLTNDRPFHDGRLWQITRLQLNDLKTHLEKNPIGQGGFGKVLCARAGVPDLRIPLVLKEIECNNDESLKSVINEKLAGRIMHFAIVPLLAVAEDIQDSKKFHYFLSPYLSNGSLFNAIQEDNKKLLRLDRIRILYQIVSAIDFLHTPVVGLRNITLHRDITTNNIVLDDKYNARLIDFGLAYELKEGSKRENTTLLSGKTNGYMGDDYPDFGIVVRELLTGRKPVENDEKLATLHVDDIETYIVDNLDDIWCNNPEEKKLLDEANELIKLSEICLKSTKNEKTNHSTPTEDVKAELLTILHRFNIPGWQKGGSEATDKCEVCMVNPIAQDLMVQENECYNHIKICVACLRNTYLNPIQCHSCFKDIEPIIGHHCGALLIAGSTLRDNKKEAQTFIKDVQDLKKIFVSKSPLIMGLSEANVVTVKADDNVSIKDQLSNTFILFKEKGLQKLIIYFRGYFINGFLIGKDNECYSKNELHSQIKTLHERGVKLFVIILDCCYDEAGLATHSDADLTLDDKSISMVQIHGCEPCQTARNDDGGVFTKFLIQALRGESVKLQCFINEKKANPGPCVICNKFQTEHKLKSYITTYDLQEYAQQHLKAYNKIEGLGNVQKPLISTCFVSVMESIIAYYIDTEVVYKFCLRHEGKKETIDMIPDEFTNIQAVRVLLFDKFIDKMNLPKLDPTYFADILRIIAYEKKSKLTDEMDSIEKIVSAWNGHLEPIVTLRDITNLSKGRVGLILADKNADIILQKFQDFGEKFPQKSIDNSYSIRVQLEAKRDIQNLFKDYKEFKENMFHAMKVNSSPQESGKNQRYSYLEIIFPYDEMRQIMKDFVCFNLCGSDI